MTLGAEQSNERLVLFAADSGCGVPDSMRDHLFEPFVTGRPEGTGLGLAVVREIAEAHGGAARAIYRSDGKPKGFLIAKPYALHREPGTNWLSSWEGGRRFNGLIIC